MPIILNPQDLEAKTEGRGWTIITLASDKLTGTPAIAAYRWSFKPLVVGPEGVHGETDQLIYVISGSGTVQVNGEQMPLEKESMLWLEPGDVYKFSAGEDGLELLQGYAPGD